MHNGNFFLNSGIWLFMSKFEYKHPKNYPVTTAELQNDLIRVAKELNNTMITQDLYSEHGKYNVTTISRRFGSWNTAMEIVNLQSGNKINYSEEQLFENILTIWSYKGKQPTRRDLSLYPSKISQSPYNRKFKSWSNALMAFIQFANQSEIDYKKNNSMTNIRKEKQTNRDPSLRLRFQVLKRDNFSCRKCGASPVKDPRVELHIDHILPWSKGGETILENLETLCVKCNLGKSNIE